MKSITIFTPTFNRKKLLERLFQSLQMQSSCDFEWMIVDDGSTDGTDEWIRTDIGNTSFTVRYLCQKNSGKHVAFNKAIAEADSELLLCVDSDDFLSHPNIIGDIIAQWKSVREDQTLAGMISQKGLADGTLLGKDFPEALKKASPFELARKYHSYGERNFIYRVKYLKDYAFPVFADEKFCPDSYITDQLSKKYTMWLRNSVDVICEYQENGLSNSFAKVMRNNPKGFCIANMAIIDLEDGIKARIKTAIRYWAFRFMAKDRSIKYAGPNAGIVKLCKLPGFVYHLYYRVRL